MGLILYVEPTFRHSVLACLPRAPFRGRFPGQIDGRYWPAERFDPSGSNRQEDMAVDRYPAAITSWRRGSVGALLVASLYCMNIYI